MTTNQIVSLTLRIEDSSTETAGRSSFSIDLLEWHRRLRSANSSGELEPRTFRSVKEDARETLAAA